MVDRYRQRGQRLDELAALDPFKYERQWKIAAKQLGVRLSVMGREIIRRLNIVVPKRAVTQRLSFDHSMEREPQRTGPNDAPLAR